MQNLHDNQDPLVRSAKARKRWGDISPVTEWRWVKVGVIPKPTKIRNRNYYPESVVQRIEREGSQPPTAE